MKKIAAVLFLLAGVSTASAAQTTQSLVMQARPSMHIVTILPAFCDMPPGTKIASLSATGGNGNPIAWTLTGTTSLVISGTDIVIGPNGVALPDCNATVPFTVTGTQ